MDGFCVSCGHMKNGEWNRDGRNWCCELCGRELDIKKPVVHVKALTYAPKIPRVLSGEIRQTIRPVSQKKPVKPGDVLLLHGWFGAPYRSPWSWRLRLRVSFVEKIIWSGKSFFAPIKWNDNGKEKTFRMWLKNLWVDDMLTKDGFKDIDDGLAFFRENYPKGQLLQVIIWDWPPIKDGEKR